VSCLTRLDKYKYEQFRDFALIEARFSIKRVQQRPNGIKQQYLFPEIEVEQEKPKHRAGTGWEKQK
jgi:hypothetical protein